LKDKSLRIDIDLSHFAGKNCQLDWLVEVNYQYRMSEAGWRFGENQK